MRVPHPFRSFIAAKDLLLPLLFFLSFPQGIRFTFAQKREPLFPCPLLSPCIPRGNYAILP
jgi:hypothetical protein